MANRNKTAGNAYELEVGKALQKIYKNREIISTRLGSRQRDNDGVDLMDNKEVENGYWPQAVQCKTLATGANYHELLTSMLKTFKKKAMTFLKPIVFHRRTEKVTLSNGKVCFMERGQYMLVTQEYGLDLLSTEEKYRELCEYVKNCSPRPEAMMNFIENQNRPKTHDDEE